MYNYKLQQFAYMAVIFFKRREKRVMLKMVLNNQYLKKKLLATFITIAIAYSKINEMSTKNEFILFYEVTFMYLSSMN